MTPQAIFDRVTTHLRTQGERSVLAMTMNPGGCAYRGKNGLSCAVGCLITDKDYRKEMDPSTFNHVVDNFPHLPQFFRKNRDLLNDLQLVHDSSDHWDRRGFNRKGLNALCDVAAQFGLSDEKTQ